MTRNFDKMNVESSLLKCESALDKLASFLKRHRAIFDVCMVDFITQNIFDSVLQPGLQEDLLKCTDQDLITLPSKLIQNEKISTFSPNRYDLLLFTCLKYLLLVSTFLSQFSELCLHKKKKISYSFFHSTQFFSLLLTLIMC